MPSASGMGRYRARSRRPAIQRRTPEGMTRLTWDNAGSGQPTWSPGGEYVAHRSGRYGETQIWVIPATGGKTFQVTDDPGYGGCPDWSPDGSMIAFRSCRAGNYDIWAVPVLVAGVPLPHRGYETKAWGGIKFLYR